MPARLAYRSPSRPRPGIARAVVICCMGASARSAIAMASTLAVSMRARCAGLVESALKAGSKGAMTYPSSTGSSAAACPSSAEFCGLRTTPDGEPNISTAVCSVDSAFRRGRLSSTQATETAMHGRSGLGRRLAPQARSAIARLRHGGPPHAVAPRQVESPRPRTSRPGMNQRSAAPLCREKVLRQACPTLARDQVG